MITAEARFNSRMRKEGKMEDWRVVSGEMEGKNHTSEMKTEQSETCQQMKKSKIHASTNEEGQMHDKMTKRPTFLSPSVSSDKFFFPTLILVTPFTAN